MTSLNLGENTTIISYQAFSGCSLENIVIPASVKRIQYKSFANNDSLKTITFESGSQLEYLGGGFYGCNMLNSVNLEICRNLTHIGRRAFETCGALTNITVPASVTRIDRAAFTGCVYLNMTIEEPNGWYFAETENAESWSEVSVNDLVRYMRLASYDSYCFKRIAETN